ncbi:MAG TPA: hypothetical protein VGK00_09035 [Anaerolineales bacterium]|jgi:hypothetical protein
MERSSNDRISNSGKFANRPRAVLVGLLLFLTLLVVLIAVCFYISPTSFISFYFSLTQRINIGDAGLLSGVPCASPCVFGIQAGRTPLDQVPLLLKANGISNCFTEPSVSWVLVSCGMGRFNVQVESRTKIVNAIWFHPNTSISVGEILKKYAEPDFVAVSRDKLLRGSTIQLYLFWDATRMSVVLPKIDGKIYDIEKATEIELVNFSDEELYQYSSEIEFGPFYKLWHGYGAY